ncbi:MULTISPECIES: response regulator transcription factor [Variovorax]|uniref:response regulator transcription factor n=1 Tax=Variovorax TaxID=34072 RepID=UPI002865A7F9|nr:winged helix-turn-helix domain-containing protein [Variovorax sp. 3319]MDR6890688.1 DNA-binding response OmpR family regulator [Variovorax sp. 3319]
MNARGPDGPTPGMPTAARKSLLIAVLAGSDPGESSLLHRLRELGHCPMSFPRLDWFLAACEKGLEFDLLLTPAPQLHAWQETLSACRALKIPILLVTHALQMTMVADALAATRHGESAGAAVDFAVLPATDTELVCRLDLAARLRERTVATPRPVNQQFGPYHFSFPRRRATLHGIDRNLTPREFQIALVLFENAGQVVERELMHRLLWGKPKQNDHSRALDMYVSKLRRKLDLREANGFELISIYKRGYELLQVPPEPGRAHADSALAMSAAVARGAMFDVSEALS